MTETRRPKLTLTRHNKTIDGVVPLPQIEQGLDRTRKGSEERRAVDGFRQQAADEGKLRGDEGRIAACANGDGREVEIAAFLAPVCSHFDLSDASTSSLASFTRKLLEGGPPRRGGQARTVHPMALD